MLVGIGNSRSLKTVPRSRTRPREFLTLSAVTRRVCSADNTKMIPSANLAISSAPLETVDAGAATIEYSNSLLNSAMYLHSDERSQESGPVLRAGTDQTSLWMRLANCRNGMVRCCECESKSRRPDLHSEEVSASSITAISASFSWAKTSATHVHKLRMSVSRSTELK